ncbi:hypothetical protein [Gordonia sp. 'Campus']|uniref:hypothetical protein n=1 Tax=Gordonia sp. 'Campus' TaxID=2915824 RepID=UPI001EE4AD57|nr:hypothetical protein [Gordonia sp. 'Campus']
MTSALSVRASRRGARKFLEPSAIIEAISIEESIVLPGYQALLASPGTIKVSEGLVGDVEAAVLRHQAVVARLRLMLAEAVDAERISSPHDEALAALGLVGPDSADTPVVTSVARSVCALDAAVADADDAARMLIAVAFLLVATHALTDPTNCGTASPALNLMPPPLHRDRALMERVMAEAVSTLDTPARAALAGYITTASAAFADAGGVKQLYVLRFNPHSLRTSCRSAGLGEVEVLGSR